MPSLTAGGSGRTSRSPRVLLAAGGLLALLVAGLAQTGRPPPPAAVAPAGLAARVVHAEDAEPQAGGRVRWTSEWQLTWDEVPGARDYLVYYSGPEGGVDEPFRTIRDPAFRLSAAAGVSDRADLARQRDGQLTYRATQLAVAVAARYADGTVGPRSAFVPVGMEWPAG